MALTRTVPSDNAHVNRIRTLQPKLNAVVDLINPYLVAPISYFTTSDMSGSIMGGVQNKWNNMLGGSLAAVSGAWGSNTLGGSVGAVSGAPLTVSDVSRHNNNYGLAKINLFMDGIESKIAGH